MGGGLGTRVPLETICEKCSLKDSDQLREDNAPSVSSSPFRIGDTNMALFRPGSCLGISGSTITVSRSVISEGSGEWLVPEATQLPRLGAYAIPDPLLLVFTSTSAGKG